jgi:hypothetical protein
MKRFDHDVLLLALTARRRKSTRGAEHASATIARSRRGIRALGRTFSKERRPLGRTLAEVA